MTDMKRRPVLIGIVFLLAIGVGCAAHLRLARADFQSAVEAFERRDYVSAIDDLERILRQRPDSARVRILLGWSLYKKGDTARAKREFEKALIMNPNEPNAFYAYEGLGWIFYKAGNYDGALAAFADSLRLNPAYHSPHNGLGWSYLAKGNLIRAAANFHAALGLLPDDLEARRGLAFVAYHHRDWTQAILRFREVLRRDDGDTRSLSALGWAFYYKESYPRARKIFADLARREPTWADPLLGLARVAEREGRHKEAKANFRAAIRKSAPYVATAESRRLLSEHPEWIDLWRELGWGLYHQRAFAQAEAEFRALVAYH
ncbi:MAG: tetratricopeptide repeat protein, partial [Candidatus Methylomirabilales bacterium]